LTGSKQPSPSQQLLLSGSHISSICRQVLGWPVVVVVVDVVLVVVVEVVVDVVVEVVDVVVVVVSQLTMVQASSQNRPVPGSAETQK